ncbi:Stf0 family sulfotransferase [Roseomonas rosulenta]|uniref:Stf0 family sulfotransferase n=1 Tax=Roseomonas rosulenta TaxID=2748667 RepID=UPI0018E03907
MKLLFEDFEFLGGYLTVRDFLSEAVVIRLVRRNKLSQAISYYMAQQTGQWVSTDPARIPAEEVCFDFDAIRNHLKRLCHQDAMWDAQLDCLGIVAEHWRSLRNALLSDRWADSLSLVMAVVRRRWVSVGSDRRAWRRRFCRYGRVPIVVWTALSA